MAKKRIRDLERSNRRSKRQIERTLKRQDKAAEKREVQAQKREEANISRQEMLSDTTPTKKQKRQQKIADKNANISAVPANNSFSSPSKFSSEIKNNEFTEDFKPILDESLDKPASEMVDVNKEGAKAAQNIAKNATTAESLTDASKVKEDVKEGVKAEAEKQEQQDEQMKEALDEAAETQAQGSAIKEEAEKGTGGYTLQDDGSIDLEKAGKAYKESRKKWAAAVGKTTTEKLNHTDYYPPQQEFLQSTFTGARIGSQQIVSAVPARIPLGLYDARRRAMAEKAKQKEAFLKELKLETAEQFQGKLNQAFLEDMYEVLDQTGGDVEGLEKGDTKLSQEWIRRKRKWEDLAKAIKQTDEALELAYTNASEDKGTFLSRKARKTIRDYRAARGDFKKMMDDPDAIEKVLALGRDVTAYTSFSKKADERITQLTSGKGWTQLLGAGADFQSLNPDAFKEKYGETKQQYAKNAQDALAEIVKKKDYRVFSEKTLTYWPKDRVQAMVEQMYKFNMMYEGEGTELDDEILSDSMEYIYSQLPVTMDSKLLQINTHAYEYEKNQDNRDYRSRTNYHERIQKRMEVQKPNLANLTVTAADDADFEEKYSNMFETELGMSDVMANKSKYGFMAGSMPNMRDDAYFEVNGAAAKFYWPGDPTGYTYNEALNILQSNANDTNLSTLERAQAQLQWDALNDSGGAIPSRGIQKSEYAAVVYKGKAIPLDVFRRDHLAASGYTEQDIEDNMVDYVYRESVGSYMSGTDPDDNPIFTRMPFTMAVGVNNETDAGQAAMDGEDPRPGSNQAEWYNGGGFDATR